jgi:predicted nucleic acid-binding protein
VILIDSSAWIEFLRGTASTVCDRVNDALDGEAVINDVVRMEVLAGARDDVQLANLRGLLARATVVPIETMHYEIAAALYRTCRRNGETVRRMTDCLIAATAIEAHLPVLHADADFDVLARHTALRIVRS